MCPNVFASQDRIVNGVVGGFTSLVVLVSINLSDYCALVSVLIITTLQAIVIITTTTTTTCLS